MIGLDISDSSVKLVQMDLIKGVLKTFCWEMMPRGVMENGVIQDQEAAAKVVKKALTACSLTSRVGDVVVASIAETQSFLRVVEVPVMAEDEVAEAVQWEVAQHIPFGLENVYLDWQPLVEGSGHSVKDKKEVLVGASQKEVVDLIFNVLTSVGLNVAALELESQAIVRALISPEFQRKQGLLIVDLGGSSTNVVVHDHGAMRFTASLQKGVQEFFSVLSKEDAELLHKPPDGSELKDKAKVADLLRSHQEELVTEIRGIVEFYNSIDEQHEVKEIILTGGGSNLPGFDDVFLGYFDSVHVQRGNPWVNVMVPGGRAQLPMSIQESVHYATAIGLSLRQVIL